MSPEKFFSLIIAVARESEQVPELSILVRLGGLIASESSPAELQGRSFSLRLSELPSACKFLSFDEGGSAGGDFDLSIRLSQLPGEDGQPSFAELFHSKNLEFEGEAIDMLEFSTFLAKIFSRPEQELIVDKVR
jgi:ubiquinone biosynthesis protein UbiJ